MKVLVPLFVFIAPLASAQLQFPQSLYVNLTTPVSGQKVPVGSDLIVTLDKHVCFVLLFVAYSLNDLN